MSGTFGKKIQLSIFGESHGPAIGITMSGLPAGIKFDFDEVKKDMKRRAPGKDVYSTARKEGDNFNIISGIFEDRTDGSPLCAVIGNINVKSEDYKATRYVMRPGHADYASYIKHNGFNDSRGGGHFSGRLTAPIVFAGALAKQILAQKNIEIGSHIFSIKNVVDDMVDYVDIDKTMLRKFRNSDFPVVNQKKKIPMQKEIMDAKTDGDSVGGIIEGFAINIPVGVGEPFFDSIESVLAHLLFSIPAVKGVEFGKGFGITYLNGSKANDTMYRTDNGDIKCYSNNNGGITGGLSNGMPLVVKVAIKPTPSIAMDQRTVDVQKEENLMINIKGRHDPCIIQRAIPVVEAVIALGLLELM